MKSIVLLLFLFFVSNLYSQWNKNPVTKHILFGSESVIADFDNDGDNDYLTIDYKTNRICVLEHINDGIFNDTVISSFELNQNVSIIGFVNQFDTFDVDNDNDLDIILTYNDYIDSSLKFGWIENIGNLEFDNFNLLHSITNYGNGTFIRPHFKKNDFNNDGYQDLISTNLVVTMVWSLLSLKTNKMRTLFHQPYTQVTP